MLFKFRVFLFTKIVLPKRQYPTKSPPVSRNCSAVTQMSHYCLQAQPEVWHAVFS